MYATPTASSLPAPLVPPVCRVRATAESVPGYVRLYPRRSGKYEEVVDSVQTYLTSLHCVDAGLQSLMSADDGAEASAQAVCDVFGDAADGEAGDAAGMFVCASVCTCADSI
ncbi:hypothetical protein EON67_11320 [archaeon]|nr:MAG: hypothetical protein EON67_11320 [archaeon]